MALPHPGGMHIANRSIKLELRSVTVKKLRQENFRNENDEVNTLMAQRKSVHTHSADEHTHRTPSSRPGLQETFVDLIHKQVFEPAHPKQSGALIYETGQ